jgi:valyl-tRNA synthetase
VNGLNSDWLVSRQRFFGVPIPVWYPLDAEGQPRHQEPIIPADASLPVDPMADTPPGYDPSQRGQPGGFAGDPDVLDTWATSSLTPQIATRWSIDGDLPARVLPMDLRPQAHEIIRTWLFYTLLRSHVRDGTLPWRHVAISGWVLDPDRKKMSKSAGNVVTPMDSLRQHGSDAVRYWAASGRLGVDLAFDPAQLKVGRRLAIKILNASRFVLSLSGPGIGAPTLTSGAPPARRGAGHPRPDGKAITPPGGMRGPASPAVPLPGPLGGPGSLAAGHAGAPAVSEPLDAAMLGRLAQVIGRCTASFEAYDQAGALAAVEDFFWFFCDDYLELVKERAYGERGEGPAGSARAALRLALSAVLRLFAPFLPFVTEEVWSWWAEGSVHRAAWPEPAEALAPRGAAGDREEALDAASAAIAAIRAAKSGARVSMRAPVRELEVSARRDHLDALMAVLADVQAAGRVEHIELRFRDRPEPAYRVTL